MAFFMSPVSIPGVAIRPPNSAPGTRNVKPKKKKRRSVTSKRKPLKRRSKKITR